MNEEMLANYYYSILEYFQNKNNVPQNLRGDKETLISNLITAIKEGDVGLLIKSLPSFHAQLNDNIPEEFFKKAEIEVLYRLLIQYAIEERQFFYFFIYSEV